MKYFLDTNIIIILFEGRYNELRSNVLDVLGNVENSFCASVYSLTEINQLFRKKKLNIDYDKYIDAENLLKHIKKILNIVKFLPFEEKHAFEAGKIQYIKGHNDPFDISIIAHSIIEKSIIISTDRKFPYYEKQGAKVIHNQR